MLYLIGGASRSGKSIVARRLLHERGIPYFSLDFLMMGLVNGLPELGFDPDQPSRVTAEKLWPLLRAVLVNILETEVDYLIEGDTILPQHVSELAQRFGPAIRACFIGYAEVAPGQKLADIRTFGGHPNDWVSDYPDDYVLALVASMIQFSDYLSQTCAQFNLPYFDSSHDFSGAVEAAVTYLKA